MIGSTTTPSGHGDMPVACNMAMQYWDIEPGVLQYIATTCIPVPDVLFRVITLVNYLRTIAGRPSLCAKRRSGTRMAIQKVVDFSPADYAAVMRDFDGWSTSGKEVSFGGGEAREQQSRQGGTSSSSPATDSAPQRPNSDLWLGLGVMYRAATLLYALRTLVVDSEDPPAQLLPETMSSDDASSSASSSVASLRRTTFSALHAALVPVFADPVSMHQVGKLIMWPLFVLGMETEHRDAGRRRFVAEGFSSLSLALGTLGPVGVVNALEVKWRMDAEREEGALPRARWDDYFQGREDFIVF